MGVLVLLRTKDLREVTGLLTPRFLVPLLLYTGCPCYCTIAASPVGGTTVVLANR